MNLGSETTPVDHLYGFSECACGSGLVAKFWTGDGWMCGECYDQREADREDARG